MTGLLKEVVDIYQRKGEGVLVTMCSTKGSTPCKGSSPRILLNSVDFPEPLGPSRHMTSPASIVIETPFIIVRSL